MFSLWETFPWMATSWEPGQGLRQERGWQQWEAGEAVGGMEALEMRPKLPVSLTAVGLCVPTRHFSPNPAKFTGKRGFEPLTLHPQQDSFPPPLVTPAEM